MAERRMFAKSIVLSDAFLDMPMGSRCLYMTLGMLADDDGFVSSPKAIMRECGATIDDMKILFAKKFLLEFDSGIIVIKHWRINNYLQNDRHKPTNYLDEFGHLEVEENGSYKLKDGMYTDCIQDVYEVDTQNSIDKNRLDKVSIDKNICAETAPPKPKKTGFKIPSLEEVQAHIQEKGYTFDAEAFWHYYNGQGWKLSNGRPMTSWESCCVTWQKKENEQPRFYQQAKTQPPKYSTFSGESSYDPDEFLNAALRRKK